LFRVHTQNKKIQRHPNKGHGKIQKSIKGWLAQAPSRVKKQAEKENTNNNDAAQ